MYDLIAKASIGGILIGRHRYLIIVYGLMLLGAAYWIVRKKSSFAQWSSILTTIAVVLLIFPIYQLTAFQIKTRPPESVVSAAASPQITAPADKELPDVYYIILDTYGRKVA